MQKTRYLENKALFFLKKVISSEMTGYNRRRNSFLAEVTFKKIEVGRSVVFKIVTIQGLNVTFLWIGFNCLKTVKPQQRGSVLLTAKS